MMAYVPAVNDGEGCSLPSWPCYAGKCSFSSNQGRLHVSHMCLIV